MARTCTLMFSNPSQNNPQTANKRNKLTFIAEPLDDGLAEKLENGKVNIGWDNRKVRKVNMLLRLCLLI